jgi:hypothetical protein
MKKLIFSLIVTFLYVGCITAAAVDTSDTNLETQRATASIYITIGAPILDGLLEEFWCRCPEIPIDRPFNGEAPTLYSAFWKGLWNDTAVFVLVKCVDNSFWPSWKSGQPDWASDKVELYFGVNGTEPTGAGPSGGSNGVNDGLYQIARNYDTLAIMGTPQANSNVAGAYEANTWAYGDNVTLTTEWSVKFNALLVGGTEPWDPTIDSIIMFDVCISDLDSGQTSRQRQMWSNVGINGEDWNTMDSAGILSVTSVVFKASDADLCTPVPVTPTLQYLITPTLASASINVPTEINKLEIIDILGRKALIVENNSGMVDISNLTIGIYNVRLFRNKEYLGCQRIIKY